VRGAPRRARLRRSVTLEAGLRRSATPSQRSERRHAGREHLNLTACTRSVHRSAQDVASSHHAARSGSHGRRGKRPRRPRRHPRALLSRQLDGRRAAPFACSHAQRASPKDPSLSPEPPRAVRFSSDLPCRDTQTTPFIASRSLRRRTPSAPTQGSRSPASQNRNGLTARGGHPMQANLALQPAAFRVTT
jgi:hypothetical protein